jgi:NADP-reducing hydrogenase subunit HndB
MSKLTLDELRKLREQKKTEIQKRETEGKDIEIIVGMGTCGIAAGAKDALDSFLKEIDANKLPNVMVRQTGCMGFCANEPTVEIRMGDMPATIYGNVNAEVAKKIVTDHIMGKRLVSDHVFDRPSMDIIK